MKAIKYYPKFLPVTLILSYHQRLCDNMINGSSRFPPPSPPPTFHYYSLLFVEFLTPIKVAQMLSVKWWYQIFRMAKAVGVWFQLLSLFVFLVGQQRENNEA